MTPQELAHVIPSLPDSELAKLPHALLYQAREYLPADQQNRVAAYEHRAFARETVSENAMMALPVAAGALAYQPYKMLMGQSRSDASFGQLGQGLMGVYEGLRGPPAVSATNNKLPAPGVL